MKEYKIFSSISIEYSWSFADKTPKDTAYITHGYYTYPAKFIPQLAARLICGHSDDGDIVIDPFMGSGTTIVEAMVNGRIGIGCDINEIACLVSEVKSTHIEYQRLLEEYQRIETDLKTRANGDFEQYARQAIAAIPQHERINYWFMPQQKEKLAIVLARITEIKNENILKFFLVAFAQILKSCSIWMQKSIKPTRDMGKTIYDPISLFLNQARKMIRHHYDFSKILPPHVKENNDKYRTIKYGDSRCLPCKNDHAALIVTSPPYVTSYEYADLHQLPLLWLGYLDSLPEFRQKFIGSTGRTRMAADLKSSLAEEIIAQLKNKKCEAVRHYFADMLETFLEMKRVLRCGGRACIVIGNTEFDGVKILNAEVFQQQFENIGFKTHDVIRREIPSKMLPSTRDSATGRFAKATGSSIKMAYPTEYILIMEKL
jgi:DNA modification methylase